ncbi:GNAT family N-acetyltransferase [Antribacter gilvus]|uniref:GNAT family N-acetyltransferase n=1 Tax=Antribacter gilvus TaxID=2304675 RepID=UPI000F793C99|nr:GNAT family N-acetyltransferase [Antribacter gilvus]
MKLFSPATRDDAVALVQSCTPTFDTAGQRTLFGAPSLERLFERGARRPELVWAARPGQAAVGPGPDDAGLGLVGARTLSPSDGLIDLISLPDDPHVAEALVGAATDWARSYGHVEASFDAPPSDVPLDEPATRAVVAAFEAHGWRVLVTRKHYEHAPNAGLGEGVPPVGLEPAGLGGRSRVEAFVRQMLPGSLDVRDQANLAERGLEAAAADETESLLDGDPIEYFRFAVVDGQDAGLVVRRVMPSGNGYLSQVGVAQAFRGRGLARRLVAAGTRDLVAEGATTLIATTDDANWPMARAFIAAGWRQTESRVDLTLG